MAFHGGKLYPYEFVRGEDRIDPPSEFIDELGAILAERALSDLIGVQVYNEGFVSVENNTKYICVPRLKHQYFHPRAQYTPCYHFD